MQETVIHKISVEFSQDGNTLGTTDNTEHLVVDVEYQLCSSPTSDEGFLTIKTDTGWSFDNISDFVNLLEKVKKAQKLLENNEKKKITNKNPSKSTGLEENRV